MANIIKPKRTSTSGNIPTTGNLEVGEIAINLADKKLYVRDTSSNILELTTRTINALDNVNVVSISDGDTLQYNSTTGKWENTTTLWSSGTGFIYNPSTVGIGTSTPNTSYKLDVNGTVNCSSLFVNGLAISGQATPFSVTARLITANYTVPQNYNGTAPGPVSVDTGVTVSVYTGSILSIT